MEVYLPIAEVQINLILILFVSYIIGFLSGLFGVGGGFLMTPLLIFMGIPPVYAVANEANNKLLTSLSDKKEALGCLRRNLHVTVIYKQTSNTVPGDFLGRLVLGIEDDEVKVFGATIY